MLRRLLVGLLFGSVIGAALAALLVGWLKVSVFTGAPGALEAYGAALVVGVVAGLVTGKPVWASGAKVEAGLKAFFGALLGAGAMFAMRRWVPPVDLHGLGAGGPASLGDLPVASLPLIGAALGALFELDNTDDGRASRQALPHPRVAPFKAGAAIGGRPLMAEPDEASHPSTPEAASKASKR
jgi:hypothetical protein